METSNISSQKEVLKSTISGKSDVALFGMMHKGYFWNTRKKGAQK
jgi:hypothetical protein